MANANTRAIAAHILHHVIGSGHSLSTAMPMAQGQTSRPEDRAFVQELCFGTLRWLPHLDALLKPLLRKPFKQRDMDIYALLLVGLYQLVYLKTPAHAAVSETVQATADLGKSWARGLVNGVLRNFQRREEELLSLAQRNESARLAHPKWLIDALRKAWPDDWEAVLKANNSRPPMFLRVNLTRQDREAYIERLAGQKLVGQPAPHAPAGILLAEPAAVERLPGFAEGDVSVQDAAAQLAADLLDAKAGQRILDACAAPGGKTGHLLETARNIQVAAIDKESARLQKIAENLDRLRQEATLVAADAGEPEAWWDGQLFDRILLDAPCSATGVIRRHPDIKVLRRANDIPGLVHEQQRLLNAVWPLLKPGGILVYATCSVLPQENSEQIQGFLKEHLDARAPAMCFQWGRATTVGRQILPGEDEMDGFYYARLVKQ